MSRFKRAWIDELVSWSMMDSVGRDITYKLSDRMEEAVDTPIQVEVGNEFGFACEEENIGSGFDKNGLCAVLSQIIQCGRTLSKEGP